MRALSGALGFVNSIALKDFLFARRGTIELVEQLRTLLAVGAGSN